MELGSRLDRLSSAPEEELKLTLKELLLKYSILRGDFTLKSGKKSTWFIDVKATVCRPEGMVVTSLLILRKLGQDVSAIGGQTMGADPIAFAAAAIANSSGRELRSFSIRKEAKDHGGGGRVAGVLTEEDTVAVVEDASSRGTSMLAAIEAVQDVGAKVDCGFTVVDRGGTASQLLRDRGVSFVALITAPELGLPYEGGYE